MRIALFSNLYPPLFLGGYELGAAQVARELQRRGHKVLILSSHHYFLQQPKRFLQARHDREARAAILDTGMCVFGSMAHLLKQRPHDVVTGLVKTMQARKSYRAALTRFRPDLFLLFNPLGVVAPVVDDCVALGREWEVPVAAYVSDHWLAEWPKAHPLWYLLRRLRERGGSLATLVDGLLCRSLSRAALLPDLNPGCSHYLYCSDFIRRESETRAHPNAIQRVIPWGLAQGQPLEAAPQFDNADPLNLIYAGQLVEHKGLPVLLQALAQCRRPHRLTVIGDDRTEFAVHCKAQVEQLGLSRRVHFVGRKSHDKMPALLAQGQVLIVPSLWDEPFSIVVLEGMKAGLVAVASDSGGTPEAIVDGETGFLFPRGDREQLTEILEQLDEDRTLCRNVAARARRVASERFTIENMVEQMLATVTKKTSSVYQSAA